MNADQLRSSATLKDCATYQTTTPIAVIDNIKITYDHAPFDITLVQISLLSDVSRGGGTFVRLGLGSGL